jgi:hypothetical protein
MELRRKGDGDGRFRACRGLAARSTPGRNVQTHVVEFEVS